MPAVTQQQKRIEAVQAARDITGALRDIAAIELKGVRDQFERNAQFSEELKDLFGLVTSIAESREGRVPLAASRDTVLHVAYTTNRHFYGSLNHNVMATFVAATNTKDRCLIIGDTGKQYWLSQAKKRLEVSFISFSGDMPTMEETLAFLERVAPYTRVNVFFPSFVSVFRQEIRTLDITFRPARVEKSAARSAVSEETLQYVLEPDIKEMLAFFNTQVRYALFERMLLETQLSRIAARLVHMDSADQNARSLLNRETRELRRALAANSSRRLLETLVGFLQWHTHRV